MFKKVAADSKLLIWLYKYQILQSFYTSFSITHFAGTLCPGLRRMMSSLTNKGTGTLVFIPSLIVHCREMHGDIGEFMNGKSSAHQSDLDKTSWCLKNVQGIR